MIISFNPKYIIKDDLHRLVIYDRLTGTNDMGSVYFMHPFHAYILGNFANGQEHETVARLCSQRLHVSVYVIKRFINELLEKEDAVHVSVGDINLNFPPKILLVGTHKHPQENIHENIEKGLGMLRDLDFKNPRFYNGPLDITWMLNNKCTVGCEYCYADTKTSCTEIGIDLFKNIVNECKANDVRSVNIIGGDIFVKHEWWKFVTYLEERDFNPSFLSTKKPLTKKELLMLKETGFSGILQLSLDSTNEDELRDILHCKTGYLNKIKQMFAEYKEINPNYRLRISTVICKYNAKRETIEKMLQFLKHEDCVYEWELRHSMMPFSKNGNILCSQKEVEQIDKYVKSSILYLKNPFIVSYIPPTNTDRCENLLCNDNNFDYRCTANMRHCFILPDGKVTLCERMYWNPAFIIGDVNKDSLVSIWQSEKALALYDMEHTIAPDSPCHNCKGKNNCYRKHKRCLVDVVNTYGKDNITYPDPICVRQ